MAIVVESFNVVVRVDAIEEHCRGGLAGFTARVPTNTFCSDGRVCRVAFMSADDAQVWASGLSDQGLVPPEAGKTAHATIYDDRNGDWYGATWLTGGFRPWVRGEGNAVQVPAVWLADREPGSLVTPPGFAPGRVSWTSTEVFFATHERVSTEEGVETWRHKETGELRYVGRPRVADGRRLDEALDQLAKVIWSLAEPHDGPLSTTDVLRLQGVAAKLAELGRALPSHAQVVLLQGVAHRRLGQWPQAEAAFRRLTELRPTFTGAWLDLTWSLAEQNRHADALRPARRALQLDPESVPAISNLAATLMFVGEVEEAWGLVADGLARAPDDPVLQNLELRLRDMKPKRRPWWRRLFSSCR